MPKYQLVGVGHMAGNSKKTGRPYDMDVLHCVAQKPPKNPEFYGVEVSQIFVSRDSGVIVDMPAIGSIIGIEFNQAGYVEDLYAVE